jgi:hypothetical protein
MLFYSILLHLNFSVLTVDREEPIEREKESSGAGGRQGGRRYSTISEK